MDLQRALEHAVGSPGKLTGTGEYNFCCPFCLKRTGRADTKYHFYANPTAFKHNIKGWYYCHRCNAAGPISRLLKGVQEVAFKVSDYEKLITKFKGGITTPAKREVLLPEDYVAMLKGTSAYTYLFNRGLSDSTIAFYRIGFGTQDLRNMDKETRSKYAGSGRIIFPDYDSDGDICYWVARTYVNHKIKYKNPAFSDASDQLYNLARASKYDDVIITEGVMSSIAAGKNAVATYGKDVTRTQIAMLAAVGFKTYYLALDGDALEKTPNSKLAAPAYRVADALTKKGCLVKLVRLPYEHDPASVPDFKSYLSIAELWNLKSSVDMRFSSMRIQT